MSDRTEFNLTWLLEAPMGIGKFPTYDGLCVAIMGMLSDGYEVISLSNNLNKIEVENFLYYWYGDSTNIILGSELHVKPQGLVVTITGKKPEYIGAPPFASDLYLEILSDTNKGIRLLSGEQLSDKGYELWERLYKAGVCVLVYDTQTKNVGQSYVKLSSYQDFQRYFKQHDPAFQRFQYVLTKKKSSALCEIASYFNLRRMRELANLDVEDFDPSWRNEKL